MNYAEIIEDNCKNHSKIPWWPKLAYHHTDIQNAVNILITGLLYGREDALRLGLMKTDNASRKVIEGTDNEVKESARFYFRPMTPTQYYNEGYKHPQLRYSQDRYANCPVPIFFTFDLKTIIQEPGTSFTAVTRAGHDPVSQTGSDSFAHLDFQKIYDNSLENIKAETIYRQAEIAYPSPYPIDNSLVAIICRNEFEQNMLRTMLSRKNKDTYRKYYDKIKVYKKDLFVCNGLYISDCIYVQDKLSIVFSDSRQKADYVRSMKKKNNITKLDPIHCHITLDWTNNTGKSIWKQKTTAEVNYEKPESLRYKLQRVPGAKYLAITIMMEQDLIGYKVQTLQESKTVF